jgi:hypothetical protein
MHGGQLSEACRNAIQTNIEANGLYNFENEAGRYEVNQYFLSLERFKVLLQNPNEIHIFGDRSHGDEFLELIITLLNSDCINEDEKTKIRASYFFTESSWMHARMIESGIDASKLFAVDVLLKLNNMPIEQRMENVNSFWTGFLIAMHHKFKESNNHFFISLGTAHLYAHRKFNGDLVPSFPYIFSKHTELLIKPYVMFAPDKDAPIRYEDPDIVNHHPSMIVPTDFQYIL